MLQELGGGEKYQLCGVLSVEDRGKVRKMSALTPELQSAVRLKPRL